MSGFFIATGGTDFLVGVFETRLNYFVITSYYKIPNPDSISSRYSSVQRKSFLFRVLDTRFASELELTKLKDWSIKLDPSS
jgi:hypothetical protein